jgi:glycosyltransferase involved in cell wall biosynthesis
MNGPLVSVLMTAYNREEYIAEAISSVLASSYQNFELIVVDDGSTDNTVAIVKRFEEKDSRIKLYVNPENLGDYKNRNRAASYAKGKYLKYLDSDDIVFAWGIQAMVWCMEQHPEAALGLTHGSAVNWKFPVVFTPCQAYFLYYFRNFLLNVGPTGVIIRRDVFESIGGFSGQQFIGDTELWLRIARDFPVVGLPSCLIWWREHKGQQMHLEKQNLEVEKKRYDLNVQFLTDMDCPLPANDAALAIRNLQKNRCKHILLNVFRGRFSGTIKIIAMYKLSPLDFMKSLQKNKVPDIPVPFEI